MSTTTKTVVKLFFGADRKRRGFFAVEGATCLELTAAAFERNTSVYQFHDIASRQQLFNEGIRYKTAHETALMNFFLTGILPMRAFEAGFWGRWPQSYSDAELFFYSVANSLHISATLYLSPEYIHHSTHIADTSGVSINDGLLYHRSEFILT